MVYRVDVAAEAVVEWELQCQALDDADQASEIVLVDVEYACDAD